MAKKNVPSVILPIPKGKVIVQESELLHVEKRKSKYKRSRHSRRKQREASSDDTRSIGWRQEVDPHDQRRGGRTKQKKD